MYIKLDLRGYYIHFSALDCVLMTVFGVQHTEIYPQMSEWRCPVGGRMLDCNTHLNGKADRRT